MAETRVRHYNATNRTVRQKVFKKLQVFVNYSSIYNKTSTYQLVHVKLFMQQRYKIQQVGQKTDELTIKV